MPNPNSTPLTITGSRAVVYVDTVAVGIFDSISYGEDLGLEAIYTLGRFSAAEICVTSYNAITVECSGYRVLNGGAHTVPQFPTLQDLLTIKTVNIEVHDRASGAVIGTIYSCIPAANRTGFHAKSTSKLSVTYMGLYVSDESTAPQAEGTGLSNEPVPAFP